MKNAMIYKDAGVEEVSSGELKQINRYTRRELSAQEVYVFPLVLCDNEIDRDGERFSIEALYQLKRLFLGKTGIFDHDPKGTKQTARIFATQVEKDELRRTGAGEVYHFLTARAYMVRSERNRDLILDIDAGIKKEVSVGCAVERVVCSVCGADMKKHPCQHRKGEAYEGQACHHILDKPTDAYEWSFVAVPAQPAAGVTKSCRMEDWETVQKQLRALPEGEALSFSAQEARRLADYVDDLSRRAKEGDAYRESLVREVLRCAALSRSRISRKDVLAIARRLDSDQLLALKQSFQSTIPGFVPAVQLAPGVEGSEPRTAQNQEFQI